MLVENHQTEMLIRSATLEDATQISALITSIAQEHIATTLSDVGLQHLLSGMTVESTKARLSQGYKFFVAHDGAEMIAIAAIRLPFHLYYLFVKTEHQRKGIGHRLWQHARKWTVENSNTLQITVNSSLNAVAAYQQMGFRISSPIEELQSVRYQPMLWEIPQ